MFEVSKKTATPRGGASKTADMVSAVLIRSELHEPEEETPSICTDDWTCRSMLIKELLSLVRNPKQILCVCVRACVCTCF